MEKAIIYIGQSFKHPWSNLRYQHGTPDEPNQFELGTSLRERNKGASRENAGGAASHYFPTDVDASKAGIKYNQQKRGYPKK